MINPHTKTGEDLAHVAEHLAAWPMNTDFVHVKSGVIHMIEGGSSSAVSYINREQWAAAKTLHQYWFPEKQPKPEGFCDVCGDIHCIHEMYPGICAEYDGGRVSLDLAKAIYNGDFRHENAEESGMNNSDQIKHWGVAENGFLAPEVGVVESFLGIPFSTHEEDEVKKRDEMTAARNQYIADVSRKAMAGVIDGLSPATDPFSNEDEDEAWGAFSASKATASVSTTCLVCGLKNGSHRQKCEELLRIRAKKQQGCSACGCHYEKLENEKLRSQIQSLRDYCDRLLAGELKR